MPSVTASANLLLPTVLRIMRAADESGDVAGGIEDLRQFGLAMAVRYGRLAVQVAFTVARVRHDRANEQRHEASRIKAFLKTLDREEESNV